MAEYIEGRRAAQEALRSGVPIKRALIAPSLLGTKENGLIAKIKSRDIPVKEVKKQELDGISSHGAHQGIALEVKPYRYASLSEIIEAAQDSSELVLVLDHLTDEGNLGAILRSAEVIGVAGVVIPSKRSAQISVGVYKTSAGAALHMKVACVPNITQALNQLKDAGFWVAGASEKARDVIWDAPLEGKIALVSGSEGSGISPLVLKQCDFLVSLPQRGKVGSLNVAQATTAIMYEWLRRTMHK